MQLQQTFSHYIDRMISGFVGMKILLLDEETVLSSFILCVGGNDQLLYVPDVSAGS